MTDSKETAEIITKYKSVLFRDGKTLVFRSDNGKFERRWERFCFLESATAACMLLDGTYHVQKIDDYAEENLGKNQSILGSFMNQDNRYVHEENLRNDYIRNYKRLRYKGFIQKYEISPSNFKKIFNAIMREIWEIKPYFSKYCITVKNYSNKLKIKIDPDKVVRLHKNIDLMIDAQNNNLNNIIPFVFYSGLSYSDLEKVIGKNLWEKLLKNSHSRNSLLIKQIRSGAGLENIKPFTQALNSKKLSIPLKENNRKPLNVNKIVIGDIIDQIEYYNYFPSTLLAKFNLPFDEKAWALKNCCSIKEFISEYNYSSFTLLRKINEVILMSQRSSMPYSLNWTKEEWIKRYEEIKNLPVPF